MAILKLFSSREISTGIWLLLFIIYVFVDPKVRHSAIDLIKAACCKQFIIIFSIFILYNCFLVWVFKWFNPKYVKDAIVWAVFVGFPLLYGAFKRNIEEEYFYKVIYLNIKISVVLEFLQSSFTFSIWLELILIPFILLLVALEIVADIEVQKSPNIKGAQGCIKAIQFILGCALLTYTVVVFVNLSSFDKIEMLVSYSIPLVLSILCLPLIYILPVAEKYRMIFLMMQFKEPDDKKVRRYHRRRIFQTCFLSLSKLNYFESECMKNMYTSMTKERFEDIMHTLSIYTIT